MDYRSLLLNLAYSAIYLDSIWLWHYSHEVFDFEQLKLLAWILKLLCGQWRWNRVSWIAPSFHAVTLTSLLGISWLELPTSLDWYLHVPNLALPLYSLHHTLNSTARMPRSYLLKSRLHLACRARYGKAGSSCWSIHVNANTLSSIISLFVLVPMIRRFGYALTRLCLQACLLLNLLNQRFLSLDHRDTGYNS